MDVENKLSFFIIYKNSETVIELYEYDTVEILKIEIHKHLDIPTHKQVISGWKNNPYCDNTILKVCADSNNINCLSVKDIEEIRCKGNVTLNEKETEVDATLSFVNKINNRYAVNALIEFHTCTLNDAISKACLVPLKDRKILLLYLYKNDDTFSTMFMENLKNPQVVEILQRTFVIVGWDIEEVKYRDALIQAFKQCSDLSNISDVINCNVSTALCIMPNKDSVTVMSCLKGNISYEDFFSSLENAEQCLMIEKQQENDFRELVRVYGAPNNMNADRYQQPMVDMLVDRDDNGFEFVQQGSPSKESGYDAKNMKQAEALFSTVLENNEIEVVATLSFVNKISNRCAVDASIEFHTCTLNDAISKSCLVPLEDRKILLLYLYKNDDKFTNIFMENLKNPQVMEILQRTFFIVGWDIEEVEYRDALIQAFKQCSDLSNISDEINCNVSTALCIVPIKDSVTVMSCLKGNISNKDFFSSLENAEKFFIIENQQEKDLEELERENGTANDMNADRYQQLMVDMLGDRDYDGFEFDQHEYLKKKIAFALMGPPTKETGYDEKDMKQVEPLFSTILKYNNQIAQYMDKVEVSFIYNCIVPLPAEKIKRAKENPGYNPNTDLMPIPIFVLRKCHGSPNPCRIFIDHTGRLYKTWDEYKSRNKLHECEMVLPLNGRYDVDRNGKVLIEKHLSPACGIDTKILQGADYVSMAGGLISGGIFLAAAIPAIAVAPAALVVGGVTGISVGIYSMVRSAYTLYDRNRHKETLSFADSEARGAYINILAGALGFVGAGANVAVTQLASRGVNIGVGARAVVDTITVVNIGASGVAVVNSGYDVYDRWVNDNQRPSLLVLVQLTSSVLFFGNAVYNFRMCSTIVEETQVRTLENYQDSLRSNRHRKVFNKLVKETVRQNSFNEVQGRAEVISAIRNIQNKDEVFAVLTRSNSEMNKRNIKISAVGGDIVLNGVKIDFNEFASMNKKQATSFLSKLSKSEPTRIETASTRLIATDILKGSSPIDIETVAKVATQLLYYCSGDVKTKIIGAVASLLASLTEPIIKVLEEIFPYSSKMLYLTKVVVDFFANVAERYEEQYRMWTLTGDDSYYHPLFRYVDVDKVKRWTKFFEQAVNVYCNGTQLIPKALEELLTYFHGWLANKIYENEEDKERTTKRITHSAKSPSEKVSCAICGGYYYKCKK